MVALPSIVTVSRMPHSSAKNSIRKFSRPLTVRKNRSSRSMARRPSRSAAGPAPEFGAGPALAVRPVHVHHVAAVAAVAAQEELDVAVLPADVALFHAP